MTTLYVVQGLGFGDDEDAWENLGSYKTLAGAEKSIAKMRAQDLAEFGEELEYQIEELAVN
jgi:hypothetical protein